MKGINLDAKGSITKPDDLAQFMGVVKSIETFRFSVVASPAS